MSENLFASRDNLTAIDKSSATSGAERRGSFAGLALAAVFGFSGVALITVSFPFIKPAFRRICLPYVPATDVQVNNVLLGLKGRTGSVIDLGSGDGRIVLAAAKAGFKSVGVELNYWLVLFSRLRANLLGLQRRAEFHRKDLWKVNLSQYDNVVIFGVNEMMPIIQQKLNHDLSAKRKLRLTVIACRFPLPLKDPVKTIGSGIDSVWVYEFKN